jgi:hypothetical protein
MSLEKELITQTQQQTAPQVIIDPSLSVPAAPIVNIQPELTTPVAPSIQENVVENQNNEEQVTGENIQQQEDKDYSSNDESPPFEKERPLSLNAKSAIESRYVNIDQRQEEEVAHERDMPFETHRSLLDQTMHVREDADQIRQRQKQLALDYQQTTEDVPVEQARLGSHHGDYLESVAPQKPFPYSWNQDLAEETDRKRRSSWDEYDRERLERKVWNIRKALRNVRGKSNLTA